MSEDLKFHPRLYSTANKGKFPALIAIARNHTGDIQAIQATYLNPVTANKADVEVKKQTFGVLKGANVLLQRGPHNDVGSLYCEGVETGLSVKHADRHKNIYAVLGISNFKTIPLSSREQPIFLCLDNDGNNSATQKQIAQACERLCKEGVTVYTNQPLEPKTDYNDVLKLNGVHAIAQALTQSQRFDGEDIKNARIEKSATQDTSILPPENSSFRDQLKKYHQQQSAIANEREGQRYDEKMLVKNKLSNREQELS